MINWYFGTSVKDKKIVVQAEKEAHAKWMAGCLLGSWNLVLLKREAA
ncbi:hypothetical protein [Pseudalkalibacillus caeni]|nr:hypothetical protein [Pseudalkalibacillus caeni]